MTAVPVGACNCCTTCSGELKFTGGGAPYPFSMHRLAWCLTDLSELWEPAIQRGENVVLPGVQGRKAEPRRRDETDYALPFIVSGVVTEAGVLTTVGVEEQLRRNLLYLRQYVLDPPTPPTATRPASLVSPDTATTLTANVQFGPSPLVRRDKDSGLWRGTLHLVVPVPFA